MQIDLFDVMYEDFRFDKPIKTLTLFSGIGFQEMGMDLAEIPYEMVGTSEIDKFAILSYAAIHTDYLKLRDDYDFPNKEEMVDHLQKRNIGINLKTGKQTITNSTNEETVKDFYLACVLNKNFGDISKLKGEDIKSEIDLMTYSFPCTDLSKAGQQAGLSCGTRSGLVYEVLRVLYELKEINNLPRVLIMENVIDLIQSKFVDEWNKIALEIEQMGYTNFTQELNGRDYGIAQNRRRVFMVSILGDHNYNYPQKVELEYMLKDYLEECVDESYYLSDRQIEQITNWNSQQNPIENAREVEDKYTQTITAKSNTSMNASMVLLKEPMIAAARGRYEDGVVKQKLETGSSETSNTITTVQKDNYLVIPEATKAGFDKAYNGDGIYINRPHQKRGVVQTGMTPTIKAHCSDIGVVVEGNNAGIINPLKGKTNRGWHFEQEIYDDKGITRALKAGGGSGNIPKVIDKKPAEQRSDEGIRYFKDDIMGTLRTKDSGGDKRIIEKPPLRIRKLTPTETGRLMGMQDYQIKKQEQVSSNAQMYKQHGNGIIAQVMALIIGMMWYENEKELHEKTFKNSFMWLEKEGKENE